MDLVHYLVVFADVRNDLDVEATFIGVHIAHYVFHRECNWFLDFLEVLNLLKLVVRELVLGRGQQAFVAKQFLSLLLSDYLFWGLLCGVKPERSWVQGEGVKELLTPVGRIQIQLVPLLSLVFTFLSLLFAGFTIFCLYQALLLFFDQSVYLSSFLLLPFQVCLTKVHLLVHLGFASLSATCTLSLRLPDVRSEQLAHLSSHFLVALFVLQLPHVDFLVFGLSDLALEFLLLLHDVVTVVFIR